MGDGEAEVEASPEDEPKSYTQLFEELFPQFLAIGMSAEEFWHGSSFLAYQYIEAYRIRLEEDNRRAWLQGWYNFQAMSTALSNLHFDGKKHKANQYLKEPVRITPLTEAEIEAKKKKDSEDIVKYLEAWAKAFNEGKDNG